MTPLPEEDRRTYTQPPRLDEAGLVAFLATQEDVVAAYLFGSLAQGRAHPRSDIDLAILLAPTSREKEWDRRLQLMDDLRRFADREVEVVTLNSASPILRHQVLRYGRRLYERDRRARVEFEVWAGKVYADLQPMYDFHARDVLQKIREVGLAGRRRRHRQPTQTAGGVCG